MLPVSVDRLCLRRFPAAALGNALRAPAKTLVDKKKSSPPIETGRLPEQSA